MNAINDALRRIRDTLNQNLIMSMLVSVVVADTDGALVKVNAVVRSA